MQPLALDDDRYYRRGRRVYDRYYIVYAASTFQVASFVGVHARVTPRCARLSRDRDSVRE